MLSGCLPLFNTLEIIEAEVKMDKITLEKEEILTSMVEASLYQKAIGYKTTETRIIENSKGEEIITITREEPPDLKSIMFWLQNKCPEKWQENPTNNNTFEKLQNIMQELDSIITEEQEK